MLLAAFILACVAAGLSAMDGKLIGLLLSVALILMLWSSVLVN